MNSPARRSFQSTIIQLWLSTRKTVITVSAGELIALRRPYQMKTSIKSQSHVITQHQQILWCLLCRCRDANQCDWHVRSECFLEQLCTESVVVAIVSQGWGFWSFHRWSGLRGSDQVSQLPRLWGERKGNWIGSHLIRSDHILHLPLPPVKGKGRQWLPQNKRGEWWVRANGEYGRNRRVKVRRPSEWHIPRDKNSECEVW